MPPSRKARRLNFCPVLRLSKSVTTFFYFFQRSRREVGKNDPLDIYIPLVSSSFFSRLGRELSMRVIYIKLSTKS